MGLDIPDSDRFRRSARRLRSVLTGATLFLAIVLVGERLGYAGAYGRGGLQAGELAEQLLFSLPTLMSLAALWYLRGAAAGAAAGAPFGRVVVRAFRRVGAWLAAGAVTAILVVPLAARLLLGEPAPRQIDADISALVLGAIGFGMLFVGLLIERAAAAQRELEEFF